MEQKYTIELSHEEALQLLTTIAMHREQIPRPLGASLVDKCDSVTRKLHAEMTRTNPLYSAWQTSESAANV